MTYRQLEEKLGREEIASIYLFVGKEEFLKKRSAERLASLLSARRITISRENEDELAEILTQPQLFGRRLILIEEASSFSKENKALLLEHLKRPESSVIILLEEKRNPNLEKFVAQNGEVVFFPELKGRNLLLWAKGLFNKEGKEISESGLASLISIVGEDLSLLEAEIEKLILFCKEKEKIEEEDVIFLAFGGHLGDNFKLFKLIKKGDGEALNLSLQLIESGISESHLLFFLANRIRKERAQEAGLFRLLAEADLSLKREPRVSYKLIILSLLLKLLRRDKICRERTLD